MNNGDLPAAPIIGDTDAFVLFLDGIKGGRNYGLTKREDFAKAAMQGILANAYIAEIIDGSPNKAVHGNGLTLKKIKERSYLMADLMLEDQQPPAEEPS